MQDAPGERCLNYKRFLETSQSPLRGGRFEALTLSVSFSRYRVQRELDTSLINNWRKRIFLFLCCLQRNGIAAQRQTRINDQLGELRKNPRDEIMGGSMVSGPRVVAKM